MRKELLWVGVIGIFFGLIIAFGAWRINSSVNKNKITPQETPPANANGSEFKITLNTPGENDVVTTTPVAVSGITKGLSWITVSGENGDYILQSDDKGFFTQDVELSAGINQIRVTAFDPVGAQSIQKVIVVYSSAFQLKTVTNVNENLGTQSGVSSGEAAIREKVAQKVADAMNQPKAYFGTVTDIIDSTIQIKSPEGNIEQIAVNSDNLVVMNAKGTANKQVKLTDIAIGDFVVAMGYVNQKSVLTAQRILITSPLTDPVVSVYFGRIGSIAKKTLVLKNTKDSKENSFDFDAKTILKSVSADKIKIAKLTDLTQGQAVILIGSPALASSAKTIFILKDI